jgi:hypothetical protein
LAWRWFPAFWIEKDYYGHGNPILLTQFIAQTAFAAVLAAVLVNLRRQRAR